MDSNIFDDFNEQSQEHFSGLDRLSFDDIANERAINTIFKKNSLFYKPIYVSENIDFPKLIKLIKGNKDVVFNWKNYIGHTTERTRHSASFGKEAMYDRMNGIDPIYYTSETVETEVPLKEELLSAEYELSLQGRLNQEINEVNIKKDNDKDITNGLEFEFDYKNKIVNYKLHYYYVDRVRVYEKDNKNNIAFTISTSNFSHFEALLSILKQHIKEDSKFKQEIEDAFLNAIKELNELPNEVLRERDYFPELNREKFSVMDWIYSKIPHFVALKLDFSQAILNVFQLDKWDQSDDLILDTTESITNILSRLKPDEVYDYFYKNPQKLILLIKEFDNDVLAEQFFAYLTSIALYKQSEKEIESIRVFNIGKDTHIETNILYGDEEGKVELVNEMQPPTIASPLGISFAWLFAEDIEINKLENSSNDFHPLDVIFLERYDPAIGEIIKVPSIAIHGKYLGDNTEWADVLTATFAVIDVVGILLSGGALSAGVRGIVRVFAVLDITISTINLVTLLPGVKEELNKTEAGRWFVAHWPLISLCVSSGMISVYLAKGILKYGKQIKTQLNNKKLSKNIDELIEESGKVVGNRKLKPLYSDIIGKPIDSKLLKKLQNEFLEEGGLLKYDDESFEYIRNREKLHNEKIEALTFSEDLIFLGPNVTKSGVYEELIHAKQFKSGKYNTWASKYGNKNAEYFMEKEAAEILIENANKWNLPKEEIDLIEERLKYFKNKLIQNKLL